MLINYGEEWQKAWDEHVKNWKPISPESDFNNLTFWTNKSEKNNGKEGYIRAETLNKDTISPIKTKEEQKSNPYPHGVVFKCQVNLNHKDAYLIEPETVPFFTREWEEKLDSPSDSEDNHYHKNCNVTDRYEMEDSSDDEEEEGAHKYLYTIFVDVEKQLEDLDPIKERHEIENVPRDAIQFVNVPYTSDVFLKNSFRHEMHLPDSIFPESWKNVKDQ